MKQRGVIELGAIILLISFMLLAAFAFKYAVPFFSNEKETQSLASQARLISLAITDDYLFKCASGTVTQATWNDLALVGLDLNKVAGISKYISGWQVINDESPKGEITFTLRSPEVYRLMSQLTPGVNSGGQYKWVWLINDDRVDSSNTYLRLYNKRCGR
ncbi:hypothetical protein [Aeromonas hydrophila]